MPVTATVRPDTGKFVSSNWERTFSEGTVSVTIGLHNMVRTIVWKESRDIDYPYVVLVPLFKMVKYVNLPLMAKDAKG